VSLATMSLLQALWGYCVSACFGNFHKYTDFLLGVLPNSNKTINYCHPSASDYQENEEDAISSFKRFENIIEDIKSRAREGLAGNAEELRRLPDKEAALTAEKALLSTSETFNINLEYVFASSGFCCKQRELAEDRCSLDWALIKVDQARPGNNEVRPSTLLFFLIELTLYL
jgi:hypothetical protein